MIDRTITPIVLEAKTVLEERIDSLGSVISQLLSNKQVIPADLLPGYNLAIAQRNEFAAHANTGYGCEKCRVYTNGHDIGIPSQFFYACKVAMKLAESIVGRESDSQGA